MGGGGGKVDLPAQHQHIFNLIVNILSHHPRTGYMMAI